jgi:hypothetical protein
MRRSRSRRTNTPAHQRGQALAFALIFLAVCAVALYVAFNASQLTSARSKLQNTADAAAYSLAVLQARDYNFAAYANRAMVANQVAVAQIVSLKSWINEVDETVARDHVVDTYVDAFADFPLPWTGPKQVARPVISPLKATVNAIAPTAVQALDLLNYSLSSAQEIYRTATLVNLPLIADKIAQANQPDTHADAGYLATLGAPRILAWRNYVKRTTPKDEVRAGNGTERFVDVVTDGASLDDFTPQRDGIRTPMVASTTIKACPGAEVAFMGALNIHAGATQLRPNLDGWEALDATSADGLITCIWIDGPAVAVFALPILEPVGRGGAANGPGGRYSGMRGYHETGHIGDALISGAAVAALIQYNAGPGRSLDNTSRAGLQTYTELADPSKATPGHDDFNRAPAITVQVSRPIDSARTTSALPVGTGRLALEEGAPAGEMRALASASAYFIRPRDSGGPGGLLRRGAWLRADNHFEYPSLFSPYWQASLVKTTDLELNAAAAAQAAGTR